MHGPDGTDYQEWISWTEIAPPERIALLHGESRGDPNAFESVLTFAPDGVATRVEMRTVFPTKELRDAAVEKYHAIEGGQQTLSKLAAYVTEIVRRELRADGREGVLQRDDVAGRVHRARGAHGRVGFVNSAVADFQGNPNLLGFGVRPQVCPRAAHKSRD